MYKGSSRFLKHNLGYAHDARIWQQLSPRDEAVRRVTAALCRLYWLRLYDNNTWRIDRGKVLGHQEAAKALRVPLDHLLSWLAVFRTPGAEAQGIRYVLDESRRRSHLRKTHETDSTPQKPKATAGRRRTKLSGKRLRGVVAQNRKRRVGKGEIP